MVLNADGAHCAALISSEVPPAYTLVSRFEMLVLSCAHLHTRHASVLEVMSTTITTPPSLPPPASRVEMQLGLVVLQVRSETELCAFPIAMSGFFATLRALWFPKSRLQFNTLWRMPLSDAITMLPQCYRESER
jgi:hypothetical protein